MGELPVGRPVGLDQLDIEPLEHRPDHRPGHPVATVAHHLQPMDSYGVDEGQHGLLEALGDVDLAQLAGRGRLRLREPA